MVPPTHSAPHEPTGQYSPHLSAARAAVFGIEHQIDTGTVASVEARSAGLVAGTARTALARRAGMSALAAVLEVERRVDAALAALLRAGAARDAALAVRAELALRAHDAAGAAISGSKRTAVQTPSQSASPERQSLFIEPSPPSPSLSVGPPRLPYPQFRPRSGRGAARVRRNSPETGSRRTVPPLPARATAA